MHLEHRQPQLSQHTQHIQPSQHTQNTQPSKHTQHTQPAQHTQHINETLKNTQSFLNINYNKQFPYNKFKRSNTVNNETIHEARPGIGVRRASAGSMLKQRTGSGMRRASGVVNSEKVRHRSEKKKTR